MSPHHIDSMLAFAALMENDPQFRHLPLAEAARRLSALLGAYYTEDDSDGPPYDFAVRWLQREGA